MNEYRKIIENISKEYEIIKNTDLLDRESEERFLRTIYYVY